MALIKNHTEIQILKKGGERLRKTLESATQFAQVGVSLIALDQHIHQTMLEFGGKPSFLGYEGYPNASCLSLNDEVVHGIPNSRVLKEGDLLGIDVGMWYEGLCTDAAITIGIGSVQAELQELLETTKHALKESIKQIKPGRNIGVISHTIQLIGEEAEYGIVRSLTGHGVGHKVHEDPSIPNVGRISDGIMLRPGMVLAIEPMFSLGSGSVITDVDGWTIRTKDGSLAAQFEHTVVVTNKGCEILT